MKEKETPSSWADIHSREKRRRRKIFYAIFSFIAIFVLIGAAWLTVYSPIFRIINIEATGGGNISRDEIIKLAETEIFGDSFWKRALGEKNILVWPRGFSANVLKLAPRLKSISIEKNYWQRKVKITVEERQPFGVWCFHKTRIDADGTQTNAEESQRQSAPALSSAEGLSPRESACWWFDSEGVIFKKAIDMEGNIILVVGDYSQKMGGLGSKIMPEEPIKNTFSIFHAVYESKINVKDIRLNDLDSQEMEVNTYDSSSEAALAKAGPKIYFSLQFPADNVVEVIKSLKEKSIFNGLQYLDFRIENRVYYK